MTKDQQYCYDLMTKRPAQLGQMLGYPDLRDDLHGEWMRLMILSKDDKTLQAHRGSYKTTCLSIALPVLMVLRHDQNAIFLRKTDTDVQEVIGQVARNLKSDVFAHITETLYGEPVEIIKENSTEITTSLYSAPRGAAQLLGIGIGGSITGKHADLVITDDIVNTKDRHSQAERERTKTAYQELQNVKNRGGRFFNTGTPWHKEDAFTIMPPPLRFSCYDTGMITPDQLEHIRNSMAPSLFAANYELQHIAAENALFATPPRFTTNAAFLRDGIAHVDAAYGGEDYTALTCGRRIGDTIYMYGRMWHSHVETLLDVISAEANRLMCAPIHMETNADKGFLGREFRAKGVETRLYPERMNKYLKISTFLKKWWKNIVWLEGTDREYLNQIMDYTEDAEHDDAPDSAACVCRVLDRRS